MWIPAFGAGLKLHDAEPARFTYVQEFIAVLVSARALKLLSRTLRTIFLMSPVIAGFLEYNLEFGCCCACCQRITAYIWLHLFEFDPP